jgi:tRNA dimethylallyltransferase
MPFSSANLPAPRQLSLTSPSTHTHQVYRGMDIGSNKPTAAERAAVRYHLLDVCDPDEGEYTAADFALQARAVASAPPPISSFCRTRP